jgi:hypothetical protein
MSREEALEAADFAGAFGAPGVTPDLFGAGVWASITDANDSNRNVAFIRPIILEAKVGIGGDARRDPAGAIQVAPVVFLQV